MGHAFWEKNIFQDNGKFIGIKLLNVCLNTTIMFDSHKISLEMRE